MMNVSSSAVGMSHGKCSGRRRTACRLRASRAWPRNSPPNRHPWASGGAVAADSERPSSEHPQPIAWLRRGPLCLAGHDDVDVGRRAMAVADDSVTHPESTGLLGSARIAVGARAVRAVEPVGLGDLVGGRSGYAVATTGEDH